MSTKQRQAKDVRRAARAVIGEPSRGRKRGPHADKRKAERRINAENMDGGRGWRRVKGGHYVLDGEEFAIKRNDHADGYTQVVWIVYYRGYRVRRAARWGTRIQQFATLALAQEAVTDLIIHEDELEAGQVIGGYWYCACSEPQ